MIAGALVLAIGAMGIAPLAADGAGEGSMISDARAGLPIQLALDVVPTALQDPRPLCEVCNFTVPSLAVEQLSAAMAADIAGRLSDWNLDLLARADSLMAAGEFGPAGSSEAVKSAARFFKYHALTAMDFIGYLSAQDRVAWQGDEGSIGGFYESFANPGIYPIWGLQRLLMGGGAFCMDFDIASARDGERMLGIRPVQLRAEKLKEGDRRQRAWSMEMMTACSGKAHYLFAERYKGRVRQLVVEDEHGPLKLIVIEQVEGFYVRKWGTHKCGAIALWRSLLDENDQPGDAARIGGAAWFPQLHLALPGPIPDVNLNDLRPFPGFQPLLAADAYRPGGLPVWLELNDEGLLSDWENEGEIPACVRDWFPDL